MARAFVAEAGWGKRSWRDHIAEAYVLVRRWRIAQLESPEVRFIDTVKAYCSGFGTKIPKRLNKRLTWIRTELTTERAADVTRTDITTRYWRETLARLDLWAAGKVPDPCRGYAVLWGGIGDPIPDPKKFPPIDCGKTLNTFYAMRSSDGRITKKIPGSKRRNGKRHGSSQIPQGR